MEITCPRCGSRYHIDPPATARTRSSRGLKFRCSNCSHTFGVDPVQAPAPATAKAAARALEPASRGGDNLALIPAGEPIRLIQQQAQIFEVPDMGTLYRWILEHRISRSDLFSVHGMRWQAVGDRPDLERFFAAAEALRGRPQPTTSRWDNMDVVPMEETPSTVEHLLHAPRHALPDPPSQHGGIPASLRDRPSNAGTERKPDGMFGVPAERPRRSAIEDQAVEIEMDSASEHGVKHPTQGQSGAQFGLSFGDASPPREASPGRVEVLPEPPRRNPILPDAPDSGDVPSSFAMDTPSSAGIEVARGQEMSFGPPPGFPEFGEPEEAGSAVAVDSASSAGVDDTIESDFLNGTNRPMIDTPVSTDQLQPVGKARPPVIQLRPPRRRREDLQDDETLEAPSSADVKTSEGRQEPLRTPPAPDPVFGPAPRVSITPNTNPPRRDYSEEEETEDQSRPMPTWVWGVAAGSVVFITIFAVLAWTVLSPKPSPVDPVKVGDPAAPSEVPTTTNPPTTPATTPATDAVKSGTQPAAPATTPEKPPSTTPPATDTPPKNPVNTPKPPPNPTAPAPTSVKNLVSQGWKMVGKDPTKARELFDRAVQAKPGNAEAVYGRGYAAAKVGDNGAARADLCQAQRLNQDPELGLEIQAGLRKLGVSCN